MRTVRHALLAGVAAIAVAGFSGGAFAQTPQVHVMTIRIPGGGVEQITYTGNVAPQVTVNTAPRPAEAALPSLFGPDSAFAQFERISQEMDWQADALLRETAMLAAAQPSFGQLQATDFADLPAGSQGYSFVSTMSGNGVCTQSMQIISTGNAPPKVVTHSSGACGPTGGTTGTIALPPAMAPQSQPHMIMTRAHPARQIQSRRPDVVMTSADGGRPYAGLVRDIPVSQR
jgi:hypothetical protein